MNALEPYDLLQACALDIVHAYEWAGADVVEAAQMLDALRALDPLLPTRIRLHHGTLSRLETLTDASVHVVYAASVFNDEIPMSAATFHGALQEIVRILAPGGFAVSRGSSRAARSAPRPLWTSALRDAPGGGFSKRQVRWDTMMCDSSQQGAVAWP